MIQTAFAPVQHDGPYPKEAEHISAVRLLDKLTPIVGYSQARKDVAYLFGVTAGTVSMWRSAVRRLAA